MKKKELKELKELIKFYSDAPKPPLPKQGECCKKCNKRSTTRIEHYWFFSKWYCNHCNYVSTYIF